MRKINRQELESSMHHVKQFIRTHINRIWTTAEVAKHFDMSRSTLSRHWRRAGESTSLSGFIARTRCQAALAMHRSNPNALCKEVAASAGYQCPEAASRSFHHYAGISMLEAFLTEHDTQ